MATPPRYQVTCITPDSTGDVDRRIDAIGGFAGEGWTMSVDDAIWRLDRNEMTLFVREPAGLLGQEVEIVARDGLFRCYLTTIADGVETNNLQNLPQCPATYRRVA